MIFIKATDEIMQPERPLSDMRPIDALCVIDGEDARSPERRIRADGLIDILGTRHRILALVDGRVLASNLQTDRLFLVQDEDGSIQLPRIGRLLDMIDAGSAGHAPDPVVATSSTTTMGVVISMLDAANVANGEKAIWIYLAAHWTPDLEAAFGKPDEPWKIRRWRTALRRTVRQRNESDRAAPDRR